MASLSPIPSPRPDDDEDVHWALSTASALWARGDGAESIKWLRRAAETASDQNRDHRSLELFKAAADATSMMQRPSTPTAPLPVPPPPAAAPSPPRTSPPPLMSPPMRPPQGPTGTLSMQLPLAPPQSPAPPPVRPSAPMPPPQPSSPQDRAPLPQRSSVRPATSGGPPAGTARAPAGQSPAPARGGPSPGFTPQRPAISPTPGAVIQARAVLKQTLPSEGAGASPSALPIAPARVAVPAARPSPATGAGAVPSSAAKRADSRKQPLDGRFHFPDEEVTVQRDLAALKRPIPINPGASADDSAAAAATVRAPPTGAAPPAARTIVSGVAPRNLPGLLHAEPALVRTPAAVHIVNEATGAEPDNGHTPIDDLDEQTSVLQGDEAELDFSGSATGESSAAMLDSLEQTQLEHDHEPSDVENFGTGEEFSDPRDNGLSVPSVRPEPMPRIDNPIIHDERGQSAWTALRVAVWRDAAGVRIEALARGAHLPPGSVGAVLVAQDDESAAALVRLLEG